MWIQTKHFKKIFENLNFDSFGGPTFGPLMPLFYTPTKVAPMSLWIKFQVNKAETFQENRGKPIYIDYFLGPDNLAHGGHFSHIKTFWENGQKPSKFIIFIYLCNKKDPLKLEAKNKNPSSTSFGAILLCTFTPNIGMIGWKMREPIGFEKKVDGRQKARYRISSTDYVRSGAKKGLNLLMHIHLYEHSFSWLEHVEYINYKRLFAFNSN